MGAQQARSVESTASREDRPGDLRGGEPPGTSAAVASRWVAEHGNLLWRFALARTRSRHAAEEIVQETLLAAMHDHAKYRGEASERSWLLGIAAHKISDHFRRLRRDKEMAAGSVSGLGQLDDASVESQFSARGLWSHSPAKWGGAGQSGEERAELLRAMQRCMQALPPLLAEAVWMRDILNVPAPEVCKALGLTPTNLWTRTHRARSALRMCIERAIGLGGKGGEC